MRSSSVVSQIGPRRPRTVRGRSRRGLPSLTMTAAARVKAPKMATSNGIMPRSPGDDESASAGMTAASTGAGETVWSGGVLDAELLLAGCWLLGGIAPNVSGQREGRVAAGEALSADPSGLAVSLARTAAAGGATASPSPRACCSASSAWASASERCGAGFAGGTAGAGAGGLAGGKMFWGEDCDSRSPSRRYQQWRLVPCSMR